MEQKGIALTILGIVAIIAIVGLVLLFTGGATGEVPRQAPTQGPLEYPICVSNNNALALEDRGSVCIWPPDSRVPPGKGACCSHPGLA